MANVKYLDLLKMRAAMMKRSRCRNNANIINKKLECSHDVEV